MKEYGGLLHYIVTMLSIHVVTVPADFYIETNFLVQPTKCCKMRNDHAKAFNTKFLGSTHSIMFNILIYGQTGAENREGTWNQQGLSKFVYIMCCSRNSYEKSRIHAIRGVHME